MPQDDNRRIAALMALQKLPGYDQGNRVADGSWIPVFLEALKDKPVIAYAAKAAGISRRTAINYRNACPEFDEACKDAMEDGIDKRELRLIRKAEQGNLHAIIFFLKTRRYGHLDNKNSDKPKELILRREKRSGEYPSLDKS